MLHITNVKLNLGWLVYCRSLKSGRSCNFWIVQFLTFITAKSLENFPPPQ
jgi:hypothetical protein